MRLAFACLIVMTLHAPAFSAAYYVPDDFPTIQAAVNDGCVASGDIVIVRPGTYSENIDFLGKAITVQSERGPVVTIIDGNQSGSVVTFANNEGPGAILDGFFIRNGAGTPSGGGVYCNAASPTIKNNIIAHNATAGSGWGGGILCDSGSSPTLENNLIFENQAGCGGGVACKSSSLLIINNTLFGNSALSDGGGIMAGEGSFVAARNTILWSNTATCGKEVYLGDPAAPSDLDIQYSDVEGGLASIHSSSGSSVVWGSGMIDADPLFDDPAGGQFRLMQSPCQGGVSNPCVDSGDPASPMTKGTTRTDEVQDEEFVDMGYHYLEKYHDQDKMLWDNTLGFILYFTDDNPANGFHDPGEPLFTYPSGSTNLDLSCWMASISNLTAYEGHGNPYDEWILHGGGPSPIYDTFSLLPVYAAGGGGALTFDDGGWMEWAVRQAGLSYQSILSTEPWFAWKWEQDPVAWCLERLAEGHPISIAIHSSLDGRGEVPLMGYRPNYPILSHAVTIWEIDRKARNILITDSDDRIDGTRILTYDFDGDQWILYNVYPDFREARVMYAICLSSRLEADTQVLHVDQGGTVRLDLDEGTSRAGREYLLLGSLAGTHPGIPLTGGTHLPLNWDYFTQLVILNVNGPYFKSFMGILDNEGAASAEFLAPPFALSPVVLHYMHFAYVSGGPLDCASNPLPLQIVQ